MVNGRPVTKCIVPSCVLLFICMYIITRLTKLKHDSANEIKCCIVFEKKTDAVSASMYKRNEKPRQFSRGPLFHPLFGSRVVQKFADLRLVPLNRDRFMTILKNPNLRTSYIYSGIFLIRGFIYKLFSYRLFLCLCFVPFFHLISLFILIHIFFFKLMMNLYILDNVFLDGTPLALRFAQTPDRRWKSQNHRNKIIEVYLHTAIQRQCLQSKSIFFNKILY